MKGRRFHTMEKFNLRRIIHTFSCGLAMGAADVVPGVSGGTMAFILGIYEELLSSIRAFASLPAVSMIFSLKLKKAFNELPWPFLLALGCGIGTSILLLSGLIGHLLQNHPVMIWAFFFGLVLASIFAVLKKVKKWNFAAVAAVAAGAVGAYILVGLVPTQTTNAWYFIMFCGALAISAMILPGISGSFILVLLGKYDYILGAVNNLKRALTAADWALLFSSVGTLALFCIGIIFGLAGFVRILQFLLRRFHDITVAALIGFMGGSLRKVWPFKEGDANVMPDGFSREVLFALLLAVLGFVLVLAIEFTAARIESKQQEAVKDASDIC